MSEILRSDDNKTTRSMVEHANISLLQVVIYFSTKNSCPGLQIGMIN